MPPLRKQTAEIEIWAIEEHPVVAIYAPDDDAYIGYRSGLMTEDEVVKRAAESASEPDDVINEIVLEISGPLINPYRIIE